MPEDDSLERFREEREVMELWRKFSRHVVAELLEACSVCDTVREKGNLTRCSWCIDVYCCKTGNCSRRHILEHHPAVAFWKR